MPTPHHPGMSHRAVGLGLQDHLRAALGDADGRFVFYQPDLRPPPAACSFRTAPFVVTVGQVSSSPGPAQGGDAYDQVFTCQVCLTAWMAYAPADRQGVEAAGEPNADGGADPFAGDFTPATEDGVLDAADRVGVHLAKSWAAVAAMNARIAGAGASIDGFVEPFHSVTVGPLDDAPPSWVGAEGRADAGEVKKVTLTLSGARRIRARGAY